MSDVIRCPQAPKISRVLDLADDLGVEVWIPGFYSDFCCHRDDFYRCTALTQKGRGPRCKNRVSGAPDSCRQGHAHGRAGSGEFVWLTAAEAADNSSHGTCWIHS